MDDFSEVVTKTCPLFFMIDTSGSMCGERIAVLNNAFGDVIPVIGGISPDVNADIKIALLEFNSGARWLTPGLVDINSYSWADLEGYGLTDFGAACTMLNESLSRNAFMGDPAGFFAPLIFLFTDGQPCDDFEVPLVQLWRNNWFCHATKVAFAIGEDPDVDILARFTGNADAVIRVNTSETLRDTIRFVPIRGIQLTLCALRPVTEEMDYIQTELINEVKNYFTNMDNGDW
jgi:uncharacterized protein YegL